MQSYDNWGDSLWIIFGVSTGKTTVSHAETVVSCLRKSRFCRETVISNAGTIVPAWEREVNVYNKLLPS